MAALSAAAAPRQNTLSQKPVSALPTKSPMKPQTRRPTLVRKRDEADMDGSEDQIPSSPSKRARVAFSEDVQVNYMDEWEKAPEMIREEVRRAVIRHGRGEGNGYDRIVSIFSQQEEDGDAPSPTTLRNYVAALIPHVSSLGRSCSVLVHALLKSDWLHREDDYVQLFIRLTGSLVSAQGVWLGEALRSLAGKFTNDGRSANSYGNASARQIQTRTHAALQYILRLVPSASQVFSTVLNSCFPHSSDSRRTHAKYVRSLLQIIEYAPELRSDILTLVTERAVKIDVEMQADLEDLAEDIEDGLVQNLSNTLDEIDEDLESETSDEESDLDDEVDPDVRRTKEINSNVQKLDLIMDILFQYYKRLFSDASASTQSFAASSLLSHFSTLILPTYRSRHTQFLLFHFFQTSPELVDNFVGTCLHLTFDKTRPALMRQSAAAYLASFVARGQHVPASITRDVFTYLGSQLEKMRDEYEPTCRGPDPRRYHTFYALSQALLYIFCFRWRDLLVTSDDEPERLSPPGLPTADDADGSDNMTFLPGVHSVLHGIIFTKINPLRVCAPPIVAEFAHITQQLRLLYVFTLIESNKRVRLVHGLSQFPTNDVATRETALGARRDDSWMCLDGYFPFDPYQLPRSKRWVEDDYRSWKGLVGDDDTDVDSQSGSDDE